MHGAAEVADDIDRKGSNNMGKTNNHWWKMVWQMLYPLLIYEGIGLLMQIFFAVGISVKAMIGSNLTDIMASEQGYYAFMNQILEAFYSNMYYSLIASAVVTIPLLWMFMRRDQRRRQAMGVMLSQIRVSSAVYPLVAVTAFAACIGGNNIILSSGLMQMDESYQQLTEILYSAPMWFQLLGTGVIVPLCEELIFRGLMYNRLKEYVPVKWALLMSALTFGIGHGNMVQGVYGFALGYMMAYLYERTNKLWVPVLFHVVANSVSVLITESGIFDVLYTNEITVLLSGAVGVLIAMWGMLTLQKMLPVVENGQEGSSYTAW